MSKKKCSRKWKPNNSEVLECECSVLGVPYRVLFGKTKKMSFPKSLCGQCSPYLHKIEVSSSKLDAVTKTEWEERQNRTIAHEVFHAYVRESGLDLDYSIEEKLALWYEQMWDKMSDTIDSLIDKRFELFEGGVK